MLMADRDPTLEIVPAPGALPVRSPLSGFLTTVGSERDADIRLTTVPPRWVIVQKEADDTLLVRVLASGASRKVTLIWAFLAPTSPNIPVEP